MYLDEIPYMLHFLDYDAGKAACWLVPAPPWPPAARLDSLSPTDEAACSAMLQPCRPLIRRCARPLASRRFPSFAALPTFTLLGAAGRYHRPPPRRAPAPADEAAATRARFSPYISLMMPVAYFARRLAPAPLDIIRAIIAECCRARDMTRLRHTAPWRRVSWAEYGHPWPMRFSHRIHVTPRR